MRPPQSDAPPLTRPIPHPGTVALCACRRRALLQHMHPLGLTDDWSDKLRGQSFTNDGNGVTYEHYMQVRACTLSCSRAPSHPAVACPGKQHWSCVCAGVW